jgi:hypothetical protein
MGPSFAGGDLTERAETKYKVLLLETSTLTELVEIHSRTPLNLNDLRLVFKETGICSLNQLQEFASKKIEYENVFNLFSKLLTKLQELNKENEPATVADIRWKLGSARDDGKKFEIDDIKKALDLLVQLQIVEKTEKEQYIALMSPKVAASKLIALGTTISGREGIRLFI